MTIEEGLRLASVVTLFAMLIASAYTDIVRNKVYNWCTFPGMFLGLSFAYMAGGFSGGNGFNLAASALGMAAGGGIIFVFSLLGGIGLGDVKLMAAVGALTGINFVFGSLLYSSMVGFVMAIGLLIWRGRLIDGLKSSALFAIRWKRKTPAATGVAAHPLAATAESPAASAETRPDSIPFGAAIAFGTMWAFILATGRAF